jgi:integrase/recombinase XerD
VRPRDEAAAARRQVPGAKLAPVEYAVAVDRYLAEAALSPASRRVYRISLSGWSWALIGRRIPTGPQRRGAAPPAIPLAVLDREDAAARLAIGLASRSDTADARTVNRELSALRSAAAWWQERGWITRDPTAGLRNLADQAEPVRSLTTVQVTDLFRLRATLREHAFWRVLYDSGAHVEDVLALDAGRIDLSGASQRARRAEVGRKIQWRASTSEVLGWLLAGRRDGPVFLTDRRARADAERSSICPVTGRARMSYRRAAEIFTAYTNPLDPAGCGWTLNQLRLASPDRSEPPETSHKPSAAPRR